MGVVTHVGQVGSGSASSDTLTITLAADIPAGTYDNPSGIAIVPLTEESHASSGARSSGWYVYPYTASADLINDFFPTITDSVGAAGPPWFRQNVHMGEMMIPFPGMYPISVGSTGSLTFRGMHWYNVINDLSAGDTITIDYSASNVPPVWMGANLHHFTGVDSHDDRSVSNFIDENPWRQSPNSGGHLGWMQAGNGSSTFSALVTTLTIASRCFFMALAGNASDTANINFTLPGVGTISEPYSVIRSTKGHIGYIFHDYLTGMSGTFQTNTILFDVAQQSLTSGPNLTLPGAQFYRTFRAHQ